MQSGLRGVIVSDPKGNPKQFDEQGVGLKERVTAKVSFFGAFLA
jgi:hypothetical protein